jgi:hypothetical protein
LSEQGLGKEVLQEAEDLERTLRQHVR